MSENTKKLLKAVDDMLGLLGVNVTNDNESEQMDNKDDDNNEEFHVDPWTIEGKVDYDKLIKQFGCQKVTPKMLVKYQQLTGVRPHAMIRRGLYYAHRDFDKILNLYEQGKKFYLYTGRGMQKLIHIFLQKFMLKIFYMIIL